MQDQVRSFEGIGLTAAFVGSDQKDSLIRSGVNYQLVYVSPEALVSDTLWRAMIQTECCQQRLVSLAVDEAHLVDKW